MTSKTNLLRLPSSHLLHISPSSEIIPSPTTSRKKAKFFAYRTGSCAEGAVMIRLTISGSVGTTDQLPNSEGYESSGAWPLSLHHRACGAKKGSGTSGAMVLRKGGGTSVDG